MDTLESPIPASPAGGGVAVTHSAWVPWLLFLGALAINLYAIGWGLPNGNDTWANDAIRPGAPLSIMHRVLVAEPWNSGWFWFKYPLGHVFVLAAVYAPYLGWQFAVGALSNPSSAYPYGMADPEATLAVLALLGRGVSALMGAGCVVLVYCCVRRGFGRVAAVAAAIVAAFCYPVVYYAHTSNVEIPYVFWLLVAFAAAVQLLEGDGRWRWWIAMGVGAAMSLSTKELGAGFFLGLALALAAAHLLVRRPWQQLARGAGAAAVASAATLILANNVLLNPSGFLNRLGFLTQTLPREVALKYAPYYFPIQLGAGRGLAAELGQLAQAGDRLLVSLSWPVAVAAGLGVIVGWRSNRGWTAMALLSVAAFYLLGARAMLSLSMRYVLPLTLVGVMFAGVGVSWLLTAGRLLWLRRALAFAVVFYVVAYGWDVNRMLAGDARYAAEAWIEAHVEDGQSIELWQRPTYLPRISSRLVVDRVAFDDRTIEAFHQRRPDYVVISSAGIAGITVAYKTDWKQAAPESDQWIPSQRAADGTVMNYRRKSNLELLDGLRSGTLGYREAAHFSLKPWVARPLIQSLNPEITIYERQAATRGSALTRGDARRG